MAAMLNRLAALALSLPLVLAMLPAGPAAAEITGKARALSGDRLEFSGTELQLYGIDAPERQQACLRDGRRWECGFEAAAALAYRVAGQWVTCSEQGRDADGTLLGLCFLGGYGGPEVNSWMVNAGWGLADRPPLFADAEAAARAAGRGIWGSEFVPPADWRHGRRLPIEAAAPTPAGLCSIKGSITAGGDRIYHLPGGAFYPATSVDAARGERWFCSAEEAEAAGWRRSPR